MFVNGARSLSCVRRALRRALFERRIERKLDALAASQGELMSKVDEAAAEVSERVTALEATVAENNQTLRELKEIVDSADDEADAVAVLAQVRDRLDVVNASVKAAEADADPTPDAPEGEVQS